jgi:nitroreductase
MENMWLVATSLGIGFHVQSALSGGPVEGEIKKLLAVPEPLRIGFACRIGYPREEPRYLRVRRDVEDFVHRNGFGSRLSDTASAHARPVTAVVCKGG